MSDTKPAAHHAPSLFDPIRIGAIDCANRMVMAPLTRSRAAEGLVPSPLAAEYYGQRATAGLIITEATQVNVLAQGYISTPGIYTGAQIEGWRRVTDEVHRRGGRIVVQLWHVGRISHTSLLPAGEVPVAPSAIRAKTKTFTPEGFVDVSEPRALRLDEIPGIVRDFAAAARNAMQAGFDGIEIHAANGYLIDQFLRDGSNHRDDEYGGSIENRTRFLDEVATACVAAIGGDRVGVRLAPVTPSNDAHDSNPQPLFERAVQRLDALGVAYIHVIEGATGGRRDAQPFDYAALRAKFGGTWIVNNGYDRDMAEAAIREGRADAVAFGVPFLANPDLVRRFREGAPLNTPNRDTFYAGGASGYADYPTLDQVAS
ncbi:alkene reductase [Cognatilysobacter lacus]|uniref:Alkene reductase n=1 Tax=Cognatilysobacter lacus TaxID=1643323 RepID=A0A5D8Z9F7_9GAMM|nr:alkene reductase [Lysobacter lacus]TZF91528.1 alkene reductase [Lysobacter lacus]